jgi:hypothetical protein
MNTNIRALLTAAATGLALTLAAGSASAQNNMIDCQLDVNAARPECQGRGKGGLVQPGAPNPAARTGVGTTGSIAPMSGGAGGQNLVNCQLDVNAGRPECLGRSESGLVSPGAPSGDPNAIR